MEFKMSKIEKRIRKNREFCKKFLDCTKSELKVKLKRISKKDMKKLNKYIFKEQVFYSVRNYKEKHLVDLSKIKKDELYKFEEILWELTQANEHFVSALLVAYIVGDKELLEATKAVRVLFDFKYYIDLNQTKHTVLNFLMSAGEKKFGKKNWHKYVYVNL